MPIRSAPFDFSKLPSVKTASFDSHEEEHNAKCLDNTRVDLRQQVIGWAQDPHSKCLFWLNGMAGTGKSTIARTVALFFKEKGLLGASFFFKQGEGDRGRAARFFTTIAADLILRLPELGKYVEEVLQKDPGIIERALKDQFEQLLLQPLSKLESAEAEALVVVIDALDECDREEDIRAILDLLERAKTIRPISLRVFVTSRPELPIRLRFEKMPDGTYQGVILHEVPQNIIQHDIEMFLRHKLKIITAERKLSPGWPGELNIQRLVQMAVPLFIFAATICRFVGDSKGNPRTRLKQVLDFQTSNQISKLEMTYLPILIQIFDENENQEYEAREFQDTVGSIVVLATPLSIPSLASLLATSKEDIRCTLDNLHSVLSIPNDENTPVRLLHLSFRDFLVDPKRRGQSAFWVDERQVHERLAMQCLALLNKSLKQDICDLQDPGILYSEINKQLIKRRLTPAIRYACLYWVYHLGESKGKIRDGDQTHQFLSRHILHWLEAMSLLGRVAEGIRMIDQLLAFIEV